VEPLRFFENQSPLCFSHDALSAELHELTVTVQTTGQAFFFDLIQYMPSNSIQTDVATKRIDYSDTAISYEGEWIKKGPADISFITQTPHAFAALTFIGKVLQWMCTLPETNQLTR